MSLEAGQEVELSIEKPAAGGRMIARHDRQVILVRGAIPGERLIARIERVERQVAFAETVRVAEASPDRRPTIADPLCGGCLYAHIAYARQTRLKAEVLEDAFQRLGRIPLPGPVAVADSPETGYRMRARFHVRGGRAGFYREGTHELCDAGATRQMDEAAIASAERAVVSLERSGRSVTDIELAENISGDQRVAHVTAAGEFPSADDLDAALSASGLSGCSARSVDGTLRAAGVPLVSDPLEVLTSGRAKSGVLERQAESFFQANRYLLPALVVRVLDAVPAEGEVLDLYAGVGLFSVALAAAGRRGISAVEGDRTSGRDLQRNAAACAGAVRVWIDGVEEHLVRRRGPAAETIIVDPPRTGLSREAMRAVVAHGANRIVYVSCDPATMARDARRLLDGGYRLLSLEGFDLFPNTPHVETLGVFER